MSKRDSEGYGPMFVRLAQALGNADEAKRLSDNHDIAQASSRSVIALTEYQDNKVARILTVVAFLSAIVGAIFTRFQTTYAWNGNSTNWVTHCTYIAFFAYALMVAIAATLLITAIRPTFNVPKSWGTASKTEPGSLFFYEKILDVRPAQWGEYWVGAENLKARAAADYIGEAYLVADKVAKKLESARAGVLALIAAMALLVVFIALTAASFMTVVPTTAVAGEVSAAPSPTPSATPNAMGRKSPASQVLRAGKAP